MGYESSPRGLLGNVSGEGYPTGPGYPSGCPGLYTACIVGRVVSHFRLLLLQRGLHLAPSALRGTSGGATMTTPGEAGTPTRHSNLLRARPTGFYHGVGVYCPTWLRPLALPTPISHAATKTTRVGDILQGVPALRFATTTGGGGPATHPSPPPSPHQSIKVPASKRPLKALQRMLTTLNHQGVRLGSP
jgi:hypothetical protein